MGHRAGGWGVGGGRVLRQAGPLMDASRPQTAGMMAAFIPWVLRFFSVDSYGA